MTEFTSIQITPAENGYGLLCSTWTEQRVFVFHTWLEVLTFLGKSDVKVGTRPISEVPTQAGVPWPR